MRASLMQTIHRLRRGSIEVQLPSLRRHAEAMSGSREAAEAYVDAVMDIVTAEHGALPPASSARVGLFKLYTRLYAHLFNQEQRAGTRARQVLLLVLMEGFSNEEAAEVLNVSMAEVITILKSAGCATPEFNRSGAVGDRRPTRPLHRSIRMSPLAAAC
ncbi:hypothetical protein [Niveispirillum sp. KHB5.9]|uniref:hypothetical protein n=1 Tax=Niveispirillum sp. KHB5.9 TaxID=3400269 RepID=UPI003A8A5B1A